MKNLTEVLEKLASFEPTDFPVISLYLNTGPNQHGQSTFQPFVRKELEARGKTYPLRSPERESLERDAERIQSYLNQELRHFTRSLALFACAALDDFFEALQLEVSIEQNSLMLDHHPHVCPEKVSDKTSDATITAALKMKFASDKAVDALKIDVDTKDGRVTLTGTVNTKAEADRAVALARTVEGAKSVMPRLTVRGG
jgi:hypothetical protein